MSDAAVTLKSMICLNNAWPICPSDTEKTLGTPEPTLRNDPKRTHTSHLLYAGNVITDPNWVLLDMVSVGPKQGDTNDSFLMTYH